jgi:hypothetical protein
MRQITQSAMPAIFAWPIIAYENALSAAFSRTK